MINIGNTIWVLIAALLVVLPAGLKLLNDGLTYKKSVVFTFKLSYVAFLLVTLVLITTGYNVIFSLNDYLISDPFIMCTF